MKQLWVTSNRLVCLPKCFKLLGVAFSLTTILCANHAGAAAFTMGDLVVVRVGDGAAALTGNATAAFLDEYTPGGVLVQSIPLPTLASGGNQPLTLSGTATSEGFIALSQNGMYLTLGGYAATVGTATPQTSTAAAVNRVIGRIDLLGNINTTTSLGDAYNGSNIRSVTSSDGVNFWRAATAAVARVRAQVPVILLWAARRPRRCTPRQPMCGW